MAGELRFDGQVAIVTGAGAGLGRSHALLLAARGASVVVNDIGGSVSGDGADPGPAEAVVAEIIAAGGDAVADTHSVADTDGGQSVVDAAIDAFGRIDIVVNNAGILRSAPFEDMTDALVNPLLDVHVGGAFHVTRPAWVQMRKQGGGRIVNTTSAAGLLGNAGMTNYGAAKGGVYGLTRVLAVEGEPYGIRVNAVAPMAATRMLTAAMGDAVDQVVDEAALEQAMQIAKILDPGLVSSVVAYLAHPDCPVTGEVFTTGGGQVARLFLARTAGFYSPDLSPEQVRDHLTQIRDEQGYTVPRHTGDESDVVFAQLAQAFAAPAAAGAAAR